MPHHGCIMGFIPVTSVWFYFYYILFHETISGIWYVTSKRLHVPKDRFTVISSIETSNVIQPCVLLYVWSYSYLISRVGDNHRSILYGFCHGICSSFAQRLFLLWFHFQMNFFRNLTLIVIITHSLLNWSPLLPSSPSPQIMLGVIILVM